MHFLYITVLKILAENGKTIANKIVNNEERKLVLITTEYCPDNSATSGNTNKASAKNHINPLKRQFLNEKAYPIKNVINILMNTDNKTLNDVTINDCQ
ncbi:hypothetical protein NWP96_02285 [Mycoplasmopsis cynos]|nr:hypothetical protein [Mycoplasmopsis cynos]